MVGLPLLFNDKPRGLQRLQQFASRHELHIGYEAEFPAEWQDRFGEIPAETFISLERFRERYSEKHYPFGKAVDASSRMRVQHIVNKQWMQDEKDFPGPRCFAAGMEFLETNRAADNWFLQIECFDPHEPFDAPKRFKDAFKTGWNGGVLNWPYYEHVTDSAEEIAEIRANYAALVAMCDAYFGELLDYMDRHDMWKDTALILTTDHGYLLSEHDWWGKNLQPYYEEISHIPMIVHSPAHADQAGRRVRLSAQRPSSRSPIRFNSWRR